MGVTTGGGIGIFAVVMGILVGSMVARRSDFWPFAFALVGCAIGLAIMIGMRG